MDLAGSSSLRACGGIGMAEKQTSGAGEFIAARDFLLRHREDYEAACRDFRWPQLQRASTGRSTTSTRWPRATTRPALWIVDEDGARARGARSRRCATRSNRVANFLRALGVQRGDRILLMLGNVRAAVGDDAGGDEARRRDDPGDHAAHPRRPARPHRRAARVHARRRRRPTTPPSSRTCPAASPASSSARDAPGWHELSTTPTAPSPASRRTAPTRGRRSAAALLHLRHDREAEAGAAHPRRAIRSATCRRCTGSACGPATSTSTSARPAGPSTPGAASSRRGTPAPPSSSTTTRASTRTALLDALVRATASPRSARRRRCGAC